MPTVFSRKLLIVPVAAGIVAAIALFLSAGSGSAQIPPAPTPFIFPTPVPTIIPQQLPALTSPQQPVIGGNVSICGVPNPGATGGETIRDASGNLTIRLIDGGTYTYGPPSVNVNQPAVAICHQQTNSTLVINTQTGREIRRVVRQPLATSVFNNIMANLVVGGGTSGQGLAAVQGLAGASSATTGAASAASTGGFAIRPPSTGDAGLR